MASSMADIGIRRASCVWSSNDRSPSSTSTDEAPMLGSSVGGRRERSSGGTSPSVAGIAQLPRRSIVSSSGPAGGVGSRAGGGAVLLRNDTRTSRGSGSGAGSGSGGMAGAADGDSTTPRTPSAVSTASGAKSPRSNGSSDGGGGTESLYARGAGSVTSPASGSDSTDDS